MKTCEGTVQDLKSFQISSSLYFVRISYTFTKTFNHSRYVNEVRKRDRSNIWGFGELAESASVDREPYRRAFVNADWSQYQLTQRIVTHPRATPKKSPVSSGGKQGRQEFETFRISRLEFVPDFDSQIPYPLPLTHYHSLPTCRCRLPTDFPDPRILTPDPRRQGDRSKFSACTLESNGTTELTENRTRPRPTEQGNLQALP